MEKNTELILVFLKKNKSVLNISGIEKTANVPSRHWAKRLCGVASVGWFERNPNEVTIKVLKDLKIDIDNLLKTVK
jgi:hypothetical protein